MSKIEKAREALKERRAWSDDYIADFESAIDAKLAEHADRIREIAREEIEAAGAGAWVCGACGAVPSPTCPHRGVAPQCGVLVRASDFAIPGDPFNQEGGDANSPGRHERPATGLDKSPPAVEAPAAGGMSLAKFLEKHQEVINEWKAANGYVLDPDTTALACQLAETLRDLSSWVMSAPVSIRTKALEALTEARKAGLIE